MLQRSALSYFRPTLFAQCRMFSASKFSSPLSQSSNNFMIISTNAMGQDGIQTPKIKLQDRSDLAVDLVPGKTLDQIEREMIAKG